MIVGIDIGTSKVAAVAADASGRALAAESRAHGASLPAGPGRAEQAPAALLDAAAATVRALPEALRRQARAVGVTGQMHGVVLADARGGPVAPLVTWQDGRCLEGGFLEQLNARTGAALRSGYGLATLAWLAAHGRLPEEAVAAGTIHDLLVARLCGAPLVTDPTDAASWGLLDLAASDWDRPAVGRAGVPAALLPRVVPCGAPAGRLTPEAAAWTGLPPGIPVAAAIGDNQASLLATLEDPQRELALTLGTGGQLSAVLAPGEAPRPGATFEYRPFPGGRLAAVGASLAGGAAWAWLAAAVRNWLADLDLPAPPEDALYARLNALGLAAEDGPRIRPTFCGERHEPSLRGRIEGIGLEGFTLGAVALGLARGIAANLRELLPPTALAGRTRVVGSGNALRRNPLLRRAAEEVFGLPLRVPESREEAACGAARNAAALAEGPRG